MSRSILSRFVPIFTSKVVEFLALFLATPIIVRELGRNDFGDYAFLLSALGVLMLLVDSGIFDGIRKFIAEDDRSPDWQDRVFGFYVRVAVVAVGVVAVGIVASVEVGVVGRLFGTRFDRYFVVLAALIVARMFGSIARSGLMGLDQERISETLQVVNKLLFVGVGLALLFAGYGIVGLLVGRIVGHLSMAVIGFAVVASHLDLGHMIRRVPADFPRRELLLFNFESFILFALYVSILHVDVLLIQWFQGSGDTGVYRAALTLAEFLWFAPRVLQISLLHSTSKLWSTDSYEQITRISARATRYTLAFTVLLVIGLAALARPVVTLYYGPDFEAAVEPLLILLPGAVGFAVARPIFAIGQGNGDLTKLNYATGAAASLNLVLNLLLIPRFGMIGAAVATSAGYLSMLGFHVWSARSIGFDPVADLRVGGILGTSVVSAVAIFLLTNVIQSDILALIVVPPVGFVVYATLAVAWGVVSVEELRNGLDQLG